MKVKAYRSYLDEVADDDTLGEHLVSVVRRGLVRGGAPPVAVTIRGNRLDMFMLREVVEASVSPQMFLAGLSHSVIPDGDRVDAVAVMGTFRFHHRGRQGPGVPTAMVFLEWGDCRWWQWRGLLEVDSKTLIEATETRGRAVDGVPKPLRLGGWFSLARRRRLSVKLDWTAPLVH